MTYEDWLSSLAGLPSGRSAGKGLEEIAASGRFGLPWEEDQPGGWN